MVFIEPFLLPFFFLVLLPLYSFSFFISWRIDFLRQSSALLIKLDLKPLLKSILRLLFSLLPPFNLLFILVDVEICE